MPGEAGKGGVVLDVCEKPRVNFLTPRGQNYNIGTDSNTGFYLPQREIKVQYRRLARIYHPDKFDPTTTEMSKFEAQQHFKQINNTYKYLCM